MAIQLTTNLLKADMPYPFSKAAEKKFRQVYQLFERGNKRAISEILKAANLYPQLPQFLNLAAEYYDQAGMREEARKINRELKQKFPLFIFSQINESMDAFLEKDAEKMLELLGEELKLESLYPERKLFHTSEYLNYTRAAMLYFTLIKDETQLLKRVAEAKYLGEKYHLDLDTKPLYQIALSFVAKHSDLLENETLVLPPLPDFQIKEVEELFHHALTIPDELYDSLLQKDRKLLIDDLEKLLQHAIDHYDDYNKKKIPAKNTFFVWHALFLLRDLEAGESLPALLNFLKQDEELVSLYLGDLFLDDGWQFFYVLGNENLRLLVDFVKSLQDDFTLRMETTEALKQIYLHQPERKLEIEAYFRELLLHVPSISPDNDIHIDDYTEALLETIGELQLTRLYPEVERLFKEDKLIMPYGIDWDDFETRFITERTDSDEIRQEFKSRKEIYREYLEAQEDDDEDNGDNDDDDDDFDDDFDDPEEYLAALERNDAYEDSLEEENEDDDLEDDDSDEEDTKNKSYIDYKETHTPYVKKEPDVGRNDPCPCGSGKKYKKCHGKS